MHPRLNFGGRFLALQPTHRNKRILKPLGRPANQKSAAAEANMAAPKLLFWFPGGTFWFPGGAILFPGPVSNALLTGSLIEVPVSNALLTGTATCILGLLTEMVAVFNYYKLPAASR